MLLWPVINQLQLKHNDVRVQRMRAGGLHITNLGRPIILRNFQKPGPESDTTVANFEFCNRRKTTPANIRATGRSDLDFHAPGKTNYAKT